MCLSKSLSVQYIHSVNMVEHRICVCVLFSQQSSFIHPLFGCDIPFLFVRSFVCRYPLWNTDYISYAHTQLDEMEWIIMPSLRVFQCTCNCARQVLFMHLCVWLFTYADSHELNSFTQKISIQSNGTFQTQADCVVQPLNEVSFFLRKIWNFVDFPQII